MGHVSSSQTEFLQDSPALQLTLPAAADVAELEGDVTTQDFEEASWWPWNIAEGFDDDGGGGEDGGDDDDDYYYYDGDDDNDDDGGDDGDYNH